MKTRDFIIGIVAVAVLFYILGFASGRTSVKPVTATEIVEVPVERVVTETVEVPVYIPVYQVLEQKVFYPKAVIVEKMVDPVYTLSSGEVVSVGEILKIAEIGRYNHQYFIDFPEEQTERTGDTSLNQTWVRYYNWIAETTKAQQNRITELERQVAELEVR